MKAPSSNIANNTISENNTMYFMNIRLSVIASVILTAMFFVLALTSTAFAQESPAMQVSIDVVPGQSENNISLGTSYAIPVAILSNGAFDAATVNPETLTLAGGPVSKDDDGELSSLKDLNGDGVQDMLVYFAADYTELNESSTEVVLDGSTIDGTSIQGIDYAQFFNGKQQQAKIEGLHTRAGGGPVFATFMGNPAFFIGYTQSIYNYVASFFAPEPASIAAPVADTVTPFTNNTKIDIPASGNTSGSANPYPSQINVSGVTGNVKKVTVTLNGISHSEPDDIDILLVGPTGKALVIMSDAGGNPEIKNLTLTLDDAAVDKVQDNGLIASDNAVVIFKPTNHATSVDNFISPAPASSTIESPGGVGDAGTAKLSVFNGLDPIGTWKLFVRDDASGDIGKINGGWTLSITTEPSDSTAPTLTLPSNITAEATSASGREVTYTTTATDANPASPTVNCTPASGSTFAIATTTVNCSAKDDYNNTANGSFTVTVRDTTAPQISGAGNITVDATSASGAPVSFNGVTASDLVASNPTLTFKKTADNSPVLSGATFPVGTTNVTITATDGYNNSSNATFDVTVNKLATSITGLLNPTVISYGQSVPQTATVQNGPANAIITYAIASGQNVAADSNTFGPIPNTSLGAGSYTLKAAYAGDTTYAGSVAVINLTVNKAGATIDLTNLSHTYDGSAKSATATTTPANLSGVSITYKGSPTAPTNAGSYDVVVTLTNDNYELPVVNGARQVTGTLVIAKADQVIAWSNPAGITYGTALGATQLNASLTTGNGALTYSPATGTVLNAGNGQTLRVDAAETTNYKPAFATVTIDVAKANQVIAWSNPTAITYGTALSTTQLNATLTTGNGALTYSPAADTVLGAGTRTLRVDAAETTNYNPAFKEVSLTVNKATAGIVLSNLEQTFNGSAKSATATTTPAGLTGVALTYSQNNATVQSPTNAGNYTVIATLTNDNYELPEVSGVRQVIGTLVIAKAGATIALTNLNHTYDNTAKSATATTTPAGLSGVTVTYNGLATAPTNAGNYAVVATLTNDNYELPEMSGVRQVTGTLVIAKADQATLTVTQPTAGTFGQALTPITNGGSGTGAVSFTASGIACAIGTGANAGKLVITSGTGTCSITATKAADDNYNVANSAPRTVTISKAAATVTLDSLLPTYDNTAKAATATTNPAGLTVNFTYFLRNANGTNGTQLSGAPTIAGSYNVVGTIVSNDYQGSAAGNLVINTRDALARYIGQTQFVTSGTSSTTAQVTLSASVQDPSGAGLVGAKAEFIDISNGLPGRVLASNINVSPVTGSGANTGTANTIVTLSSGQYGAESYLILVRIAGNYDNTDQVQTEKTASVVVSKPAGTNEAIGGGTISADPSSAGTYGGINVAGNSTYSVGMKYNNSGTNPQGKITLEVPQTDGSRILIKSNSISSMATTNVTNSSNVIIGKKSTIYTKSGISKVEKDGTVVAIEGGVSLRFDMVDAGTTKQIGYTVLSSSNSNLFYSNKWVLDTTTNAWRTVPQAITTGTVVIK